LAFKALLPILAKPQVTKYFLQNLNLTRVEVDEIWEFIKKTKKLER